MLPTLQQIKIIPELLQARVAETPDAMAYLRSGPSTESSDGRQVRHEIRWKRFSHDVGVSAAALHSLGLKRGSRLVIQLSPCYEWEVIQHSAFRLGVAVVGVDPVVAPSRVAPIIEQLEPLLWICSANCRIGTLPPSRHLSCPVIVVGANGEVESQGQPVRYWSDVLALAQGHPLEAELPEPVDPAVIVFTSGTTGEPRGIEYDHQQLLIACRAFRRTYTEVGLDDRTLSWLPMSGLFQRMVNLGSVVSGGVTSFVEQPSAVMAALQNDRPTFLVGVPRFFEKLAYLIEQSGDPWLAEWATDVKFLISGSAPLLPSIQERLRKKGLLVLEAYGLSENCVPLCANRKESFRPGTVGKPLEENELRIDEDGEILVRGPGLFRGYLHSGLPADRITQEGFYRTGDYGYLDEEGFMHLLGRKSSLIKTSTGRRIASMSVEAAYGQSPLVEQIVVYGEGRTRLAAFLVVNWEILRRFLPTFPVRPADADDSQRSVALTLLLDQLQACEASLPEYEQVDVFGVLENPLTVESGELTGNFKVRRDVVLSRNKPFLKVLDQLTKRCAVASWSPESVVERPRTG